MTGTFRILVPAILIMALATWFMAPAPQPTSRHMRRDETWKLPVPHQSNAEKTAAALNAYNLWGIINPSSGGGGEEESINPPEWRISGIAGNGDEKTVLVSIAGKPVQFLKTGDELPGGAKILKIHEDRLCILLNGRKFTLVIFQ